MILIKQNRFSVRHSQKKDDHLKRIKRATKDIGAAFTLNVDPKWGIPDFDGIDMGTKIVEKLNLPKPNEPKSLDIKWPSEPLPEVTGHKLSELLGQLAQACAWAQWVLTCAEAECWYWESEYIEHANHRLLDFEKSGESKERNQTMREIRVDEEGDIHYRLKRYKKALMLKQYLEGYLKSYDHYFVKMSRELSRREGEHKRSPR